MADETPVFQIQRVYLKGASLEQPNSPAILLEQEQPSVDIQLGVNASPVADGIFEVTVTATVQTKIKDKTVFLIEAQQAGIFEIRNLPEEQMSQIGKWIAEVIHKGRDDEAVIERIRGEVAEMCAQFPIYLDLGD